MTINFRTEQTFWTILSGNSKTYTQEKFMKNHKDKG